MAFPTIPTVASGDLLSSTTTTAGTTHTFPSLTSLRGGAGPQAGDLLIAVIVQYQGGTSNAEFSAWGASFTELLDDATVTALDMAIGVAYKIATGSESGTFTVTSAHSFISAQFLMRIPAGQWTDVPAVLATVRATNAMADPGALDPANWAAEDTLWIAVGGFSETTLTGSPPTLDTPPTNYTGQLIVARAADAIGNVTAGVAFRQLNASSENVGTWAVSNPTHGNGVATVLAVRPLPQKTGSGISARSGSAAGTEAVLFVESGSGVTAFVGSGARALPPQTYTKTGLAVMGIEAAGNTYTKQNAGVAPLTATASDLVLWTETGGGVLVRSGGAADAFSPVESGVGVSPRSGGGASAKGANTYVKTGSGVTQLTAASSPDVFLPVESGVAVSQRAAASSPDVFLPVETGAAVSPRSAGGVSSKAGSPVKTGAGVSAFTAGASDAFSSAETGSGVSPRAAGAADAFAPVESGSGVLVASASGTETKTGGNTYAKSGLGRMGLLLGTAYAKSGAGVQVLSGSGADVSSHAETGAGVAPFSGSGQSQSGAKTFVKTGSGVTWLSTYLGGAQLGGLLLWDAGGIQPTGAKAVTFGESGSGVLVGTAGGVEQKVSPGGSTYAKTGAGVTAFVGSGSDASTHVESGAAVADLTGGGTDADLHVETGSGVLTAAAAGSETKAGGSNKTGSGVSAFSASGTDAFAPSEAGLAIASLAASGADTSLPSESGSGVLAASASGASSRATLGVHTGAGVSAFSAGGAKAVVYSKTGAATSPRAASGADAYLASASGVGVAPFTASGSNFKGAAYVKAGSGISTFTAGGTRARERNRTGLAVLTATESGSKALLRFRTGTATRVFVGAGPKAVVFQERGSGVAPLIGTGVKWASVTTATDFFFDRPRPTSHRLGKAGPRASGAYDPPTPEKVRA